ncbi:MAG: VOC family protein [Gemmataceae bacterium]
MTALTPYLFFGGRCEEALAFYRDAVGAEVEMLMRFDESPEPPPPGMLPAGFEKKVMHASVRIGGAPLMVADGCEARINFEGFQLALTVPTEEAARKAFDGLAAGGKVTMPLTPTFWSPCFGMVADKFGVTWMVMVPGQAG